MKKVIFILLVLCSQTSLADEIHLVCSGSLSIIGESDNASAQEFEIDVDTTSGELYGFPLKLAPACGNSPDVKQQIKKGKFKFGLSCTSDIGYSSLLLSRQTGTLETTFTFKSNPKLFTGIYKCKKAGKPLF